MLLTPRPRIGAALPMPMASAARVTAVARTAVQVWLTMAVHSVQRVGVELNWCVVGLQWRVVWGWVWRCVWGGQLVVMGCDVELTPFASRVRRNFSTAYVRA